MSEANEELLAIPMGASSTPRIEWGVYAQKYDSVCQYNPAYQENVQELLSQATKWNLPGDASIADLGAGTGNFICALAPILPDANFTHVDCDHEMNALARRKYRELGLDNVTVVQNHLQRLQLPDASFDAIICVNALYAIAPQDLILKKINRWLKPGGKLFIIDFGRPVRLLDWGWYLLKHTVADHGFLHFTKALWDNIEFVKQNRKAQHDFSEGTFWEHTTEDFEDALTASGFEIEIIETCYRDYCDLAICTAP